MPNITKTEWASLIPIQWATAILAQVRANIIGARLARTDFANELAVWGDTVRVSKIGAFTAADKIAGTAVTRQAPATTSLDLVLNKHKVVPFLVEDPARTQANPNALQTAVTEAGRALAEQFETDLFAAISAAAAGANIIGTFGTDASETLLLTSRKTFVDSKAPQTSPRAAIWHSKDVNALFTTSTSKFTKANERGDNGDALREGYLGRLYGIDHYESQLINVVVGAPNQTSCLGFVPEAVQYAVRPQALPPAEFGVNSANAIDEASGLAIRVVFQYNIDQMGVAANADLLYGIKVVRPEWVQLIRT